ncbi:MAG: GH3 auxin-responsive promoter family protein [Vicinamibacterales bacterium]
MHLRAAVAQFLWGTASLGAWRRLSAALRAPAPTQRAVLLAQVAANRDSAYGRAHGFDRIRSVAEFQRQVPMVGYDDLQPWIDRVAAGEAAVLTVAPVRRLSPSSGSTRAAKLVPWTAPLQQELGRAVDAWIADLYLQRPRLICGPSYWSVTPALDRAEYPPTRIPVGFDDDSAYLGGARQRLVQAALVAPGALPPGAGMDAFRRATLRALLLAPELRVISVWHPSFLALLLDALAAEWPALVDDIARDHPRRAARLAATGPRPEAIWPHLGLVSCWGDGPAGAAAEALAARLPAVELQRKGLMATEGVVTVPFAGRRPLAVRSHFFEFLADDGAVRLAHELDAGAEYSVVVTTGGGLYRYRLGDRVRVDGTVGATPSLTFVGRDDRVSDRCGEKLSDSFVAAVLETLFAGAPRPAFAMLAPEQTAHGVSYTLFVDRDHADRAVGADALERQLRRNPHYAWCVDLGQLAPARVVGVGPGAAQAYLEACVRRGQRLGDVKPVSLHHGLGWREVLPC